MIGAGEWARAGSPNTMTLHLGSRVKEPATPFSHLAAARAGRAQNQEWRPSDVYSLQNANGRLGRSPLPPAWGTGDALVDQGRGGGRRSRRFAASRSSRR